MSNADEDALCFEMGAGVLQYVRCRMEEKGMSTKALARRMGVSASRTSEILLSRRPNFTLTTLVRLVHAVDGSISIHLNTPELKP